jgi:hypothetical protein
VLAVAGDLGRASIRGFSRGARLRVRKEKPWNPLESRYHFVLEIRDTRPKRRAMDKATSNWTSRGIPSLAILFLTSCAGFNPPPKTELAFKLQTDSPDGPIHLAPGAPVRLHFVPQTETTRTVWNDAYECLVGFTLKDSKGAECKPAIEEFMPGPGKHARRIDSLDTTLHLDHDSSDRPGDWIVTMDDRGENAARVKIQKVYLLEAYITCTDRRFQVLGSWKSEPIRLITEKGK